MLQAYMQQVVLKGKRLSELDHTQIVVMTVQHHSVRQQHIVPVAMVTLLQSSSLFSVQVVATSMMSGF